MHPLCARLVPGSPSNHDNLAVTLIGDDPSALLNIALPADSFT